MKNHPNNKGHARCINCGQPEDRHPADPHSDRLVCREFTEYDPNMFIEEAERLTTTDRHSSIDLSPIWVDTRHSRIKKEK
mgnify:CR=1 FL=1